MSEEAEAGTTEIEGSLPADTDEESRDVPSIALAHLQHILKLEKLDVQASIANVTPEEITLNMHGADSTLLIGRHGQTLDSLQYLLLVIMSSEKSDSSIARITIDVDGYRQRRIDTLTRYALSIAAQVRSTGQEAELDPLNAVERRVVHTALANDPYVETYSEGYGQERRVVISPRRKSLSSDVQPGTVEP